MNETISPLIQIKEEYPESVYFTPSMIAATVQLTHQQVCKYCRQLWPKHEGHYRFWNNEISPTQFSLSMDDLENLLRYISQNRRK